MASGRGGREGRLAHRLAVGLAAATFVLILFGGLVTNTGAALAVPDWPTTFGHNMLLYPWSRMVGGIFYEHSHRLLGAFVGLLTLALALAVWVGDGRRWLRGLALVAVAAVALQGLLGGLRVLWLEDTLAVFHGALAQAFFALTVALALFTSPGWTAPAEGPPPADATGLRRLALLVTGLVYLQVVFGALLTHLGRHLDAHLALAALLVVLVPLLAARALRSHRGDPFVARLARLLPGLLALQVLLGVGAYVARFTGLALPVTDLSVVGLPVAHRLTGGLLLATSVALALGCQRHLAPLPARVRGRLSSREVPA
jgi:cytochrome c oxidase assembly protein subunit 15